MAFKLWGPFVGHGKACATSWFNQDSMICQKALTGGECAPVRYYDAVDRMLFRALQRLFAYPFSTKRSSYAAYAFQLH